VHHLADAHMNAYIRCKFAATQPHPTIMPYDQDAWAALPDSTDLDLAPSLALLGGLHTRMVAFFTSLPEEAWQRTLYHPERGTLTLRDLLAMISDHCLAHIDQITRTLAAAT